MKGENSFDFETDCRKRCMRGKVVCILPVSSLVTVLYSCLVMPGLVLSYYIGLCHRRSTHVRYPLMHVSAHLVHSNPCNLFTVPGEARVYIKKEAFVVCCTVLWIHDYSAQSDLSLVGYSICLLH